MLVSDKEFSKLTDMRTLGELVSCTWSFFPWSRALRYRMKVSLDKMMLEK